MPIKATKVHRFTAWSYSRLNDYLLCPLKAKLKYLEKLPEPESEVLKRGSDVHEKAAAFISGKLDKLPVELKLFPDEFRLWRRMKASVETQWAFDKDWRPLPEPDGWFSDECYIRVVVDTHLLQAGGDVLDIRDHKTGKVREENKAQLELYAICGFMRFSRVKRVRAGFWYLDQGEEVLIEFTRDQLEVLKKKWTAKATPMMNDTNFAPRPNNKCKWCTWRAEAGGPCKF